MTSDEEALFAQLEGVFAKVDAEEVEDLTLLTNNEIVERLADLEVYIRDEKEWLHPRNRGTRDAHSERDALNMILNERLT